MTEHIAATATSASESLKKEGPISAVAAQLPPSPRVAPLLVTLQSLCSVLLLLVAFFYLRIMPNGVGIVSVYAYFIYVAAWLLFELCVRAHTSQRPNVLALVTGQSTSCRRFNLVQLCIYTFVTLFVLDSYFSPYMFPSHREHSVRFARMGALSPSTATLHVRYPEPLPPLTGLWDSGIEDTLQDAEKISAVPVRVVWRRVVDADASKLTAPSAVRDPRRWERGPVLTLSNATDWTATTTLTDLWPATRYEWRLAFVHNNTFAPLPERPIQFVTWPDPRLSAYRKTRYVADAEAVDDVPAPLDDPNHFRFASFSCIKPDFPYHPAQFWGWNWLFHLLHVGTQPGGFALRNRVRGFDLMAERLIDHAGRVPGIRFMLELGDLIYADVPRYEGPHLSSYRKLYRNLFASESFRRVFSAIPMLGIYDDHEVVNNWSGGGGDDEAYAPPSGLNAGLQAWYEYVGAANPPSTAMDEHYYSFQYGDTAFFVMDTRRHRSHPQYHGEDRTMLGDSQRAALLSWLTEVNSTTTFKFLVSSVPFTSLWGGPLDFDGRVDGWSAYSDERKLILDAIQYVPNVIILSGDRHEFAAVSFRDAAVEFSTSPLSMFYIPIRTLSQEHTIDPPGEERLLKYLPDGNHKWSEFEVDTRDPLAPVVKVTVQVDGKDAWQVTVHGVPVRRPHSALGSLAQTLLELLGFKNRRWF